jgi:hypothetical protein
MRVLQSLDAHKQFPFDLRDLTICLPILEALIEPNEIGFKQSDLFSDLVDSSLNCISKLLDSYHFILRRCRQGMSHSGRSRSIQKE